MKRNNPTQALIGEVVLEPPAEPAPISIVTLSAELGDVTVAELVTRLGDSVFVEAASGLRCVSVEVCRRVIDEQAEGVRRRARAMAENEAKLIASRLPLPGPVDEYTEELAASALKAARR